MSHLMKICKDCQTEYPATTEYFHKAPHSRLGLNTLCKTCRSKKRKAAYRDNPELAEKERLRVKRWYHSDIEHARKQRRESHARNPQSNRDRVRQWRESNPNKYQQQNAYSQQRYAGMKRRRANKLDASGSHTPEDIQAQYDNQDSRCYWCSNAVHDTYHADHVTPLSRGGSDNPDNIVIACPSCNGSKQDKLAYIEWIPPNPLVMD